MELVREYRQRPKGNLDPVIFSVGYSRIVQRPRQPIGFSLEDAGVLLMAPPGTFKNILLYRDNYYVAPHGSEYPYVGLKRNGQTAVPACFKHPPREQEGQVTLKEIKDRSTCSSQAHLDIGPVIGF